MSYGFVLGSKVSGFSGWHSPSWPMADFLVTTFRRHRGPSARAIKRELRQAFNALEPYGYRPNAHYCSEVVQGESMRVEEALSWIAGLNARNFLALRKNVPEALRLVSEISNNATDPGVSEACADALRHLWWVSDILDLGGEVRP